MRFEIMDVEHGFAAFAQAQDGSVILFDCGHSPACRPSDYLHEKGINVINRLFVTNYDEDHIGDLPRLRERFPIEVLTRNFSLTSAQLRNIKTPPISPAMTSLLDMIDQYTDGVSTGELEMPGLRVWFFNNEYPNFTDTNNLSLLIFLDLGTLSFVLPGDLERAGWLELLKNPLVRIALNHVNVFVASHHGRESGYCKEVFEHCSPSLIVMSDSSIEYDTQRMASVYGQHATGELLNAASGQEFRKVISTRKDGHLFWEL